MIYLLCFFFLFTEWKHCLPEYLCFNFWPVCMEAVLCLVQSSLRINGIVIIHTIFIGFNFVNQCSHDTSFHVFSYMHTCTFEKKVMPSCLLTFISHLGGTFFICRRIGGWVRRQIYSCFIRLYYHFVLHKGIVSEKKLSKEVDKIKKFNQTSILII